MVDGQNVHGDDHEVTGVVQLDKRTGRFCQQVEGGMGTFAKFAGEPSAHRC